MPLARALLNISCGFVLGCGLATSGFSFWPGTGSPIANDISRSNEGSAGFGIQYQDAALVFTPVTPALMAFVASLFSDCLLKILWVLAMYSMKGAYFYMLEPIPWVLAAMVLFSPTGTFVHESLEMAFALLLVMQGFVFIWAIQKILDASDDIDKRQTRRSQRRRGELRTLARKNKERAISEAIKAKSSTAAEMPSSSQPTDVAAAELEATKKRLSEALELHQAQMKSNDAERTALLEAKDIELAELSKASECALEAACDGLRAAEETVSVTRGLLDAERTALARAVAGFQRKTNDDDADRMTLLRAKAAQVRASECELGSAREEVMAAEADLLLTRALLNEQRTESVTKVSDFQRQLEVKDAELARAERQAEMLRELYDRKEERISDQMALVMDQGNRCSALKRRMKEANRTISDTEGQITLQNDEIEAMRKDNDGKQAEIARLGAEIARLLDSDPCSRAEDDLSSNDVVERLEQATDELGVNAGGNPEDSTRAQPDLKPPVRKDMVFFGDETVMGGDNVSPALGKGITPNNGSASTLACTISPGGSSVASVVSPSDHPSPLSASSSSSGTASPPCPPEVDEAPRKRTGAMKRKAKREKRKAAELAAMRARIPMAAPDAKPAALR